MAIDFIAGTSDAVRDTINGMVEKLIHQYSPDKIILFGSFAYGTPQQDSDIDLLVIKQTSGRFLDRWVEVRRILSDPKRVIPIELLVLTPEEVAGRLVIGDQFIKEIILKGQVLYNAA